MPFKILKKSKKSNARLGVISTPHGEIQTPAFIPVGTQATVKGITPAQLDELGTQAVLCNTYHLYLRPGDAIVKKQGGLHRFMNWPKSMFTDSGGFQVFSLGLGREHGVGKITSKIAVPKKNSPTEKPLVTITEEGVEFRSHLDGAKLFLSPEKSMQIQKNLGADIIFAFDECTSPLSPYEYTKQSMARTHRWAQRSLTEFKKKKITPTNSPYKIGGENKSSLPLRAGGARGGLQMLFGIVQGGEYQDLREESSAFIGAMDFDGFGIGGSFGDKVDVRFSDAVRWSVSRLPEEKPRHLLGIGGLDDITVAVEQGIDTFDCVIPTRLGRHGSVLLATAKKKTLNLNSGTLLKDKNPIDKKCHCYTCQNYSRGYLAHLFRANEMLGPTLATIHNLQCMEDYMRNIREAI